MKKHLPILCILFYTLLLNVQLIHAQKPNTQKPIWKFNTQAPFFSSPVVESNSIYIGGLDSVFYCLNKSDGSINWKLKTMGAIRSTAKISGETLYFFSGDGTFYALNKNNGSSIWTFQTRNKNYDPFDYYQSSPLLAAESIIFGSGDGFVYSLNKVTGKEIWSYKTGDVVHSTPAVYKNKIYINSFDGYTYALNEKDGTLAWKFKSVGHRYFPKGEMQFSPVISNGLVFVSGRDYNLYALDAEKGFSHWNKVFTRGWAPVITPSPENDSLIYIGTSDDYLLLCLNSLTGQQIWKTNVKFNVFGACTFQGDTGYVSTLMGTCFSFNRKSGELYTRYTSTSYDSHHLDYFKADDTFRDDIYSILHSNEDLIEAEYKVGGFYSTPAISDNLIFLSSTDGNLYCYKINVD